MMEINAQMVSKNKRDVFDSYDPVVEKWMSNLVATTPITAKAMKSLYTELNRKKDLKRSYRRKYKDLQAIVTTTTESPATSSQPVVVSGNKVNPSPQVLKAASIGQDKKLSGKGKGIKPPEKGKKMLLNPLLVQPLWLALLPT